MFFGDAGGTEMYTNLMLNGNYFATQKEGYYTQMVYVCVCVFP